MCVNDAARQIGISASKLYQLVQDRQIAHYAEKISELLGALTTLQKRPHTKEANEATAKLTAALTSYAEDFGEPAAKQLERYARRKAPRRHAKPVRVPPFVTKSDYQVGKSA